MFFEAKVNADALRVLSAEVVAKRFTSKTAGDAGIQLAGNLHAFRPEDGGPIKFGATGPKPVAIPKTPAAAVKLAEKLQAEIDKPTDGPVKFGSIGEDIAKQMAEALVAFVMARIAKELGWSA